MKKVVDNSTVAHLWANRIQDEATNPQRNFWFEKDYIYSYGRHFPIARHYNGVVLFTTRGYSNTTNKHIYLVKRAASGLKIVECHDVTAYGDYSHNDNIKQFIVNIEGLLVKLAKAKKPESYINRINCVLADIDNYRANVKFKLDRKHSTFIKKCKTDLSSLSEHKKEELKKQKAAAEKRLRQIEKMYEQYVQLWHKGQEIPREIDNARYNYLRLIGYTNEETLLRKVGNVIETSKGVKIPVDVAKRYYDKWVKGELVKFDKVLDYTVVAATPERVIIGCHNIPASEIRSLFV